MRVTVRIVCLFSIAAGLAAVPACSNSGTGDRGDRPRVAIVTNCTAEFWSICEAGAKKAAADFDADLDFRQPKTLSVSDQRELVDAVIRVGASGVAVSVINPEEQTPYLRQKAKEVNLVTMDNDAPESGRLCYIGIDNYEAGKAVGRMVKQAVPGGGTIALFIGGTASANAKARIGGVLDELAGQKDAKGPQYGQYTLFNGEPITDGTDEAKAQANAKAVIEQLKNTPNVCLIGLYAYNPKQIVLAYRSKRSDVKHPMKIVGFDEDWTTLEAIANGEIEGTVVQDPFNYGYKSVEILAALGRGDRSKLKDEPIPYRVITKDGGPDEMVNGILVKNLPVAEFQQKLKDDLASVTK
jgi:ribose transport system substrate-binding protein